MKILDLGAHDGFVSRWLHARLIAGGVEDVHIDGVELNPDAVHTANERMRDAKGQFRIGAAEDAPDLFRVGSYDIVVAFELIEHVPDVGRLLDACERMCKPGGLVFVSTPDGTFGAGNNPHHLRCYRAVELAN